MAFGLGFIIQMADMHNCPTLVCNPSGGGSVVLLRLENAHYFYAGIDK